MKNDNKRIEKDNNRMKGWLGMQLANIATATYSSDSLGLFNSYYC